MKIHLNLSEEQDKFLKDNPDINLQEWFNSVLNDKISRLKAKSQKMNAIIALAVKPTAAFFPIARWLDY